MKTKYPHHNTRRKQAQVATDFKVLNGGSVYLFCPGTEAATAWLAGHCPADGEHQYLGPNLCVEHRFAQDLANHAINAGLTVS
jgi:hypothetical protein